MTEERRQVLEQEREAAAAHDEARLAAIAQCGRKHELSLHE